MFPLLRYDSYQQLIGWQYEGFVTPISGKVFVCGTGHPAEGTEAGLFEAAYINRASAIREGEDVSAVLKGLSRELAALHDAVFEGNSRSCRSEVQALWEDPPESSDLLAIPRLSVYADHRGRGLGLATLWQLLRTHAHGAEVVALQARPLQFCEPRRDEGGDRWLDRMRLDEFSEVPRFLALEKLIRHYRELGFVPFGNEGLLLLNTRYPLPLPPAVRPWVTPWVDAVGA